MKLPGTRLRARELPGPPEAGVVPPPDALTFLGLQGMLDPPRAGVREAIAGCQDAGMRVVMITGDHAETAASIGSQLGIATGAPAVVLVVLAASIAAVRRDPRFDRREILVQLAWIAAYFAGCAGLAFLLVPLGHRIGPAAATAIGVAVIGVSMAVLARHLKGRMEK